MELPSLSSLQNFQPDPLPCPNLGYACICLSLSNIKPLKNKTFTNRTCTKKTFESKGLDHISQLILANVTDLAKIILWNHENKIRLYRMSSDMLCWCTNWQWNQLKDYELIKNKAFYAGELARKLNIRLSFHPSMFIQLGSTNEEIVNKSLIELERHSEFLDMMGFKPSLWTKINFHIGGFYNDKQATIERFKMAFRKLSSNCQKRCTLENDDRPNLYSIDDILPIAKELNIAIVFDDHHYSFCPGKLTKKDAFLAAISTWPEGIRPTVHHSESEPDGSKMLKAHSRWISNIDFFGYEDKIDIMIESKMKDLALLKFRKEKYNY